MMQLWFIHNHDYLCSMKLAEECLLHHDGETPTKFTSTFQENTIITRILMKCLVMRLNLRSEVSTLYASAGQFM